MAYPHVFQGKVEDGTNAHALAGESNAGERRHILGRSPYRPFTWGRKLRPPFSMLIVIQCHTSNHHDESTTETGGAFAMDIVSMQHFPSIDHRPTCSLTALAFFPPSPSHSFARGRQSTKRGTPRHHSNEPDDPTDHAASAHPPPASSSGPSGRHPPFPHLPPPRRRPRLRPRRSPRRPRLPQLLRRRRADLPLSPFSASSSLLLRSRSRTIPPTPILSGGISLSSPSRVRDGHLLLAGRDGPSRFLGDQAGLRCRGETRGEACAVAYGRGGDAA